jgi:hypothetical protein
MQRQEIRDAVLVSLREAPTPVRWSNTELNQYIQDGYVEMAERTGAVVATRTISCPPNAHFIQLPSDTLYPIACKDVGTGLPVDPVHWSFLDSVDDVWIRLSSTRPDMYAMFGLREIILYPAFQTTSDLELILAIVPAELGDPDEPDLPEEYHYGLVHYAHARSLLKDAHGDEAGIRLGRAKRQIRLYKEAMSGLGTWSFDRQKHITKAIYGERFRMPTLDAFGVGVY